jgi:hypothetical protein
VRIFRFDDRVEGQVVITGPGDRDVICAGTRKVLAGTTLGELVQWMVKDASLDRCDR